MNDREVKRYEMFNRVVTFGHDNAADFTADSKAAGLFAQLIAVMQQVDAARTGQMGGRATARSVLLDALRIDLKNIARTAREIEDDKPGFADRFRMPTNNSQAALLTTANRMVEDLKKDGVAAQFIAYELPETRRRSICCFHRPLARFTSFVWV